MNSPPSSHPSHLERGGDKEVLLLQAQLLALVRAVVGIQHAAERLSPLLGQDRSDVVP